MPPDGEEEHDVDVGRGGGGEPLAHEVEAVAFDEGEAVDWFRLVCAGAGIGPGAKCLTAAGRAPKGQAALVSATARRAFVRTIGISPAEYKWRFGEREAAE